MKLEHTGSKKSLSLSSTGSSAPSFTKSAIHNVHALEAHATEPFCMFSN